MQQGLNVFIGTTLEDNPVAEHFIALGQELAQRGHRVVLLTPHRKTELERHQDNPAIYTWPSERPTRWQDAQFLQALIRERQPNYLIAHFAAVNLMCMVGAAMRVPRRIAWYHTTSDQLNMDHHPASWKRSLLRWRRRLVYGLATDVAANSQASARDVQSTFGVRPGKCRVFYNSLADPLRDPVLKACEPAEDRLVCVGRFFPSKGQDVLLQALARLQSRHPQICLELIGEGPAKPACQELAKQLGVLERCRFLGRIPHAEVLRQMRSATAVVSPSRSEAFGLVNIEALAVSAPLVASAVGGIPEIIRDGIEGYLVPPDEPVQLAKKLDGLLSDARLRAQFGARARARFLSTFEQKRIVEEQISWLHC